jgi:hypothetical protein
MGGPIEGLPMTLNGEGRTDLPFPGRHGMETSPTSTTIIPWLENHWADQATMTFLLHQETSQLDDNLPLECRCACREATQRQ